MPTDQQVALARPSGNLSALPGPSTQLSKTTRQAFPRKLYELVNDPSKADLIRWSDTGDSFSVLDHERLAREVLGRWFKHQNFQSFVRQLNNYGFHKVPHLQQGVLRSDSEETEFWNFEHPNFRRGQPELLRLIQRKKQATQADPDADALLAGSSSNPPLATESPGKDNQPRAGGSTTALTDGQVSDIHAIINGIAAIRCHQTTISDELTKLKRSNQLLWQEASDARKKHQQHQDTINRILEFLAGVFGANGRWAAGTHPVGGIGKDGNGGRGRTDAGKSVYPRKKQRLMIEEAPKKQGKGKPPPRVVQVEEEDDPDAPVLVRDASPASLDLSPDTSAPTPQQNPQIVQPAPISATSNALTTLTPPPTTSASSHNVNTSTDQDSMMQAFQQMLGSPDQMQRLLAALATHNLGNSFQGPSLNAEPPDSGNGLISPYGAYPPNGAVIGGETGMGQGQLSLLPPSPTPLPPSVVANGDPKSPTLANSRTTGNNKDIISIDPSQQHLVDNTQMLDRTWKVSQDIDKDVDALQNSITSLIETFGLNPTLMGGSGSGDGSGVGGAGTREGAISGAGGDAGFLDSPPPLDDIGLSNSVDMGVPEFDFDAFWHAYGGDGGAASGLDGSTEQGAGGTLVNGAVSHNITPPTGGEGSATEDYDMQPPASVDGGREFEPPLATVTDGGSLNPRGRKRKSDVAEIDDIQKTVAMQGV